MFGLVPRLQSQVLSIPTIANNEWLAGTVRHPAGPFTSTCSASLLRCPLQQPPHCALLRLNDDGSLYESYHCLSGYLPRCARVVHFWAPTAKWLITAANIADLQRPVEKLSIPQQTGESHCMLRDNACLYLKATSFVAAPIHPTAVTVTGVIWSRYATQITPVNYNLFTVNVFMASVGLYQMYRIFTHKPSAVSSTA